MIGIDPGVMCHRLNIFPNCTGLRKKRRPVSWERAMTLKEEVDRLLEVGLIKESYYPKWLANPVLVKRPNGKRRRCVDFTDLNKACPKDSFPLPRTDQLVDAMAGHALLSFMDAYSGYNQIPMCNLLAVGEHDVQKTRLGEPWKYMWTICWEIEANPAKIKALLDMKSPTNVKQVQSLTRRIAALNRFVSKSSDRCKEFFKEIKLAGKDFDGQQSPVYYVSKRLHNAETRYTSMDKLVYALILASRKLRSYFQAHRIEVRTTYPLRQVLYRPESSGRLLKWAMELGQFDLEYMPRTTIRGQALADFLLEFDFTVDDKALVVIQPPHNEELLEEFPHPWWILHMDGAVNNGGAGAGIVLVSPRSHHLMSAIHFKFYATNNDAEYEALINGLKIALEMGCLIEKFKIVRLECVPWEKNSNADALEKMGSQQEVVLLGSIPLEIQEISSIPEL
ncbi:uncharacterized protein LOC141716974 [Apium graveolens]|uniref:uncharacterized protein LOC141716974 n=1 Tax=Apium graveolens TaxID=4045 RepID=UPI003D7B5637